MRNLQDQGVTQQVSNRLASRGLGSPCRVMVESRNGEVTLTGNVQYAQQKGTAVKAVSGVAGVRRVVDHLVVTPAAKR